MKKHLSHLTYITLLISPTLLAESYYLKKNETVSELLYNRLKITPIYRNGYLDKVLAYNNLTPNNSTNLPVGTEIRLPPRPGMSEVEPVAEEAVSSQEPENVAETAVETEAEPETAPGSESHANESSPGKKSFYVGVKPTVEIMKGDLEPSEFSSSYLYPQAHLGFMYESENYLQILEGNFSYLTFKRDQYMKGNNQLFNGGLFYQFLKKQDNFRYGLKLSAENTTLVVTTEDEANYSLKNPLIIFLGPSFQLQQKMFLHELNVLYAPSQKVDSDNDLKNSLGLQLSSFRPLGADTDIGLVGGYFYNQVEDTKIHKASLGISARWHF